MYEQAAVAVYVCLPEPAVRVSSSNSSCNADAAVIRRAKKNSEQEEADVLHQRFVCGSVPPAPSSHAAASHESSSDDCKDVGMRTKRKARFCQEYSGRSRRRVTEEVPSMGDCSCSTLQRMEQPMLSISPDNSVTPISPEVAAKDSCITADVPNLVGVSGSGSKPAVKQKQLQSRHDSSSEDEMSSSDSYSSDSSSVHTDVGTQRARHEAHGIGDDSMFSAALLECEEGPVSGARKCIPVAMAAALSPHPRALQEQRFVQLATEWHSSVTVPEVVAGVKLTGTLLDAAVSLPKKHCFWKGCPWTGDSNADRWTHIRNAHWSSTLAEAVAYYHSELSVNMRLETVLNQVAGIHVRRSAPFACAAIDRRSLRNLHDAISSPESVQSVICFCCGCTHPLVQLLAGSKIQYYDAFHSNSKLFLGLSKKQVHDFFGLYTYLEKYGIRDFCGCSTDLNTSPFREEFEDWTMTVSLHGQATQLLCCPEDVTCPDHQRRPGHICKKCQIPLCHVCSGDVFHDDGPKQPAIGFANDMWTGYASDYVYRMRVTYLELLVASPCCLSLICFVLQAARDEGSREERTKKRRTNLWDQPAHMQDDRTAARGNITMFPMPLCRDVSCQSVIESICFCCTRMDPTFRSQRLACKSCLLWTFQVVPQFLMF